MKNMHDIVGQIIGDFLVLGIEKAMVSEGKIISCQKFELLCVKCKRVHFRKRASMEYWIRHDRSPICKDCAAPGKIKNSPQIELFEKPGRERTKIVRERLNPPVDLTGHIMGKFIIIDQAGRFKKGPYRWVVKCISCPAIQTAAFRGIEKLVRNGCLHCAKCTMCGMRLLDSPEIIQRATKLIKVRKFCSRACYMKTPERVKYRTDFMREYVKKETVRQRAREYQNRLSFKRRRDKALSKLMALSNNIATKGENKNE